MMMFSLSIDKREVMIGDRVKYLDKEVVVVAINYVDFNKRRVTVRGYEVK